MDFSVFRSAENIETSEGLVPAITRIEEILDGAVLTSPFEEETSAEAKEPEHAQVL
jgi:hypothetical protein